MRSGSSVFLLLFLALDDGLADQHGAALELVQGLGQLEVLVAAELGRPALFGALFRLFLKALEGFLAGFFTARVLDFRALAAAIPAWSVT